MKPMRSLVLCLAVVPVVAAGVCSYSKPADAAGDAGAVPPCYDAATRPNPIYVAGGDVPLLAALARQLALESTQVSIIQQAQRSCTALTLLNSNSMITGNAAAYAADGTSSACTLDAAGVGVDVAFSDSFASTCGTTVAADVGDFFGPISPQVFVVPVASTQKAISAEAAYLSFGVHNGSSAPWTDTSIFFVRDSTSGTQQVISSMIGVPATQWWGSKAQGSSVIIPGMIAVPPEKAEGAIGTLPSENAQVVATRAQLRILAFQATGQLAAFWPDSTVNASDKRNVRDGHYALWGPLHLFAHVVGGQPSVSAAPIISRFTTSVLAKQVLDSVSDNFLVPQCAMRVRRTTEGGPISAYTPEKSCACYYDFRTTGKTSCTACSSDSECSAGASKCNFGYCEEK